MPAPLAFSKHESLRLRWDEHSESPDTVREDLILATDAYDHNPNNDSLYVPPPLRLGCVLMATFDVLQGRRSS